MNVEEIHEYLKKVNELNNKLTDDDKDTLEWLIFGYNQCAKLLNEKEETINKTIEYFKYQLEQLDFYKDTKSKMLCSMGIVLLKGEDNA